MADANGLAEQARLASLQGDRRGSRQLAFQALAADGQCVLAWLVLAGLGKGASRQAYLRHVLSLEPDDPRAREALAELDGQAPSPEPQAARLTPTGVLSPSAALQPASTGAAAPWPALRWRLLLRRAASQLVFMAITLLAIAFLTSFGLIMAERGRQGLPAAPLDAAGQAMIRTGEFLLAHPSTYVWSKVETPAFALVWTAFVRSAGLLGLSLLIATGLGLPLGVLAAGEAGPNRLSGCSHSVSGRHVHTEFPAGDALVDRRHLVHSPDGNGRPPDHGFRLGRAHRAPGARPCRPTAGANHPGNLRDAGGDSRSRFRPHCVGEGPAMEHHPVAPRVAQRVESGAHHADYLVAPLPGQPAGRGGILPVAGDWVDPAACHRARYGLVGHGSHSGPRVPVPSPRAPTRLRLPVARPAPSTRYPDGGPSRSAGRASGAFRVSRRRGRLGPQPAPALAAGASTDHPSPPKAATQIWRSFRRPGPGTGRAWWPGPR